MKTIRLEVTQEELRNICQGLDSLINKLDLVDLNESGIKYKKRLTKMWIKYDMIRGRHIMENLLVEDQK